MLVNRHEFDVLTTSRVPQMDSDLRVGSQAFTEASWFPGYSWRFLSCGRCGAHLGWRFELHGHDHDDHPDHIDAFNGFIINKLQLRTVSEVAYTDASVVAQSTVIEGTVELNTSVVE